MLQVQQSKSYLQKRLGLAVRLEVRQTDRAEATDEGEVGGELWEEV